MDYSNMMVDQTGDQQYWKIIHREDRAAVLDHVFNFTNRDGLCICGCRGAICEESPKHLRMFIWGHPFFFHNRECYRHAWQNHAWLLRSQDPKRELRRKLALLVEFEKKL